MDKGPTYSEPWWSCVFEQSKDLATLALNLAKKNYQKCRKNTKLGADGIPNDLNYYVTPFDSKEYWRDIESTLHTATSAIIVAQFFESKRLLALIERQPNTKFTILVDDAYYVAATGNVGFNFISPVAAKKLLQFDARLDNVEIRYLQTNHFFDLTGITNTVHARSIYMETAMGPVSLLGSAHFRDGAVNGNSEMQMIFRGALAQKHKAFFEELLSRSSGSSEAAFLAN